MSKTYIAHLQERYIEKRPDGEEWLQMPVDVSGHELMIKTIIPLTPCTDMVSKDEVDKIYDEARERGYKEGQARGYQEGMFDMYEAVMKLIGDVEDDSFRSGCMVDLFACEHAMTVMNSGSPEEIIKKVKELEDRQKALQKEADLGEVRDVLRTTAKECHVTFDEIAEVLSGMMEEKTDGQEQEIKVGDEVEAVAGKAVIIQVFGNGDVRYMYPDASIGFNDSCSITRTGRHFPEIAKVLRKMKE